MSQCSHKYLEGVQLGRDLPQIIIGQARDPGGGELPVLLLESPCHLRRMVDTASPGEDARRHVHAAEIAVPAGRYRG